VLGRLSQINNKIIPLIQQEKQITLAIGLVFGEGSIEESKKSSEPTNYNKETLFDYYKDNKYIIEIS